MRHPPALATGYTAAMPIHDWTRVYAGIFHDFHQTWIIEIRRALQRGLLPAGYYAQAEQVARQAVSDVLTLQLAAGGDAAADDERPSGSAADIGDARGGSLAVAVAPPRLSVTDAADDAAVYAARADRVAVRHVSGDRVVAFIELVSPGNKHSRTAVEDFVDQAVALLSDGVHLQVVDLFPPRRFDPDGLHGAIWEQFNRPYAAPAAKPLTAAAYSAAQPVTCYVEPLAVGDPLPELPLFLTAGRYVNVPLEQTYMAAYADVPQRWKAVIEAAGPPA